MSTTHILLGVICLAALGCRNEPGRRLLIDPDQGLRKFQLSTGVANQRGDAIRRKIIHIAHTQLGIREATGNNDGVAVEVYLNVTALPKGNPWCAAFVSWTFAKARLAEPRNAWSPALFPLSRRIISPSAADVFGIHSAKLERIAHVGLVVERKNNWVISIEGNTNADGSREGDGVYKKRRHIRTIALFADWVKDQDYGHKE